MDVSIEVKNRMASLVEFAKTQYKDRGEFIPMFEIMGTDAKGENGSIVVILAGPAINNRFEILKKLGQDIGRGQFQQDRKITPLAVIFAAETWISHTPGTLPSEAKDRQEALTAMYQTIDGKGGFASWFIKRGEKIEMVEYKNVDTEIHERDKEENNLLKKFWEGYFSVVSRT